MTVFKKMLSSSTFWVGLVIPVIKLVSGVIGFDIPWEVVCTAIGGYAVKEAAAKIKNV